MRKTVMGLVILSIVLIGVFTAANKALMAETYSSDSSISKKLDEVLNNQKTTLQALEDLKKELYIIKIRVTQAQ